jgi:hypothetical protein
MLPSGPVAAMQTLIHIFSYPLTSPRMLCDDPVMITKMLIPFFTLVLWFDLCRLAPSVTGRLAN